MLKINPAPIITENSRRSALDNWTHTLKNQNLRKECPDAYHQELIRQSDEMDRQGLITWEECREQRKEADRAFLRAIAGEDYK